MFNAADFNAVVGLFQGTKDFMSGMGLGMIAEQLADLKLGELLDTPPPGLDEAVAIAKVIHHFLQNCSRWLRAHAIRLERRVWPVWVPGLHATYSWQCELLVELV